MDNILTGKFMPQEEQWNDDMLQNGYHTKAFHILHNKYLLHEEDGIDTHHDESSTYAPIIPIASLS